MHDLKILKKLKLKLERRGLEESLVFVTVGVLAAIVCSLFALLFSNVEHLSESFFSTYPFLSFILFPLGMLISFLLVRWFAPGSSGSGIPQVLVCIDKSHQHLASIFLRKIVIVIKIISSLVAVFAGAAIGREGPSLQISAAIAHNIGKFFDRYKFSIRSDQLLIAGAASGLAAAFNTPVGGIVYAIEELSQEHVRNFKDVLLIAVVISGLTAQLIVGNYLYLGYPTILSHTTFTTLALIVLVSLCSGLLGAFFSKGLMRLQVWRTNQSFNRQILIVLLIGLILAVVFYFFGPRCLYSGKESINHVLFSSKEIPFLELPSRIIMPMLSSMTGIAGGIFAPSLSAGAVLGGTLANFFDPSIRNILALSGMVGFLTGVTHTPITSFILVLEMTDRHSAVFPMMIAALFSSLAAHIISKKSFYESTVDVIKNEKHSHPWLQAHQVVTKDE